MVDLWIRAFGTLLSTNNELRKVRQQPDSNRFELEAPGIGSVLNGDIKKKTRRDNTLPGLILCLLRCCAAANTGYEL